jgi:hypothetical protein
VIARLYACCSEARAHQEVIKRSSGGHQELIRRSSGAHQVVIEWSSGGHQLQSVTTSRTPSHSIALTCSVARSATSTACSRRKLSKRDSSCAISL